MALFPFKNPVMKAMLNFGGTLRLIWIWSGIKCPLYKFNSLLLAQLV
jgi:hypothetical protein